MLQLGTVYQRDEKELTVTPCMLPSPEAAVTTVTPVESMVVSEGQRAAGEIAGNRARGGGT